MIFPKEGNSSYCGVKPCRSFTSVDGRNSTGGINQHLSGRVTKIKEIILKSNHLKGIREK
jgi:hypothetical protein